MAKTVAAWAFVAFCGVAVLSASRANAADDCPPLKLVNSVDLQTGPARLRYLVPVTINGAPKLFLLDTGGDITQVTAATTSQLNLPLRDSTIKMLGGNGGASTKAAVIDSFQLGRMKAENLTIFVSPFGNLGPNIAGLLAADLMNRYDVELDFAAGKMNYFSQDHCDGKVIYWPAQAVAVVPIKTYDRKIRVPVVLDGKHLTAELDTGATGTTMLSPFAKRVYGLAPDSPGATPMGQNGGQPVFGHVFDTLSFEGISVAHARVTIEPDLFGSKDPDNINELGSNIRKEDDNIDRPDLLIGMDVLRQLHLFIAFKEGNLYITPASAPAPTAAASSTPPVH